MLHIEYLQNRQTKKQATTKAHLASSVTREEIGNLHAMFWGKTLWLVSLHDNGVAISYWCFWDSVEGHFCNI